MNRSLQGYKSGATMWLEGRNVFFWTYGGRQVRHAVHKADFRDNITCQKYWLIVHCKISDWLINVHVLMTVYIGGGHVQRAVALEVCLLENQLLCSLDLWGPNSDQPKFTGYNITLRTHVVHNIWYTYICSATFSQVKFLKLCKSHT